MGSKLGPTLYVAGGCVAIAALLFAASRSMRSIPPVAQLPPANDAAPLYWAAIQETESIDGLFDSPSTIDPSSPALQKAISDFKKAASMPVCNPVAAPGRSLGKFLQGLEEGATLVDSDFDLRVDHRLETASTQMKMAEQASKILSGRKTAGEIELRAVHTWWRAMCEEADTPSVLVKGQAWLDQTSKAKDFEWLRMFPNHHMAQIALNILSYRLRHKGNLPATLEESGGGSIDPSTRKKYYYTRWPGSFELSTQSNSDSLDAFGALRFNAIQVGREHKEF